MIVLEGEGDEDVEDDFQMSSLDGNGVGRSVWVGEMRNLISQLGLG